jgi:hypothetical protein
VHRFGTRVYYLYLGSTLRQERYLASFEKPITVSMSMTGPSHVLRVPLRVLFMSACTTEDLEVRSRVSDFVPVEKPFCASVVPRAAHDIPAGRA